MYPQFLMAYSGKGNRYCLKLVCQNTAILNKVVRLTIIIVTLGESREKALTFHFITLL